MSDTKRVIPSGEPGSQAVWRTLIEFSVPSEPGTNAWQGTRLPKRLRRRTNCRRHAWSGSRPPWLRLC